MEEPQETLAEEIKHEQHDTWVRSEVIIGGLVVIVVVLGGVIWYMATHPAPIAGNATNTTATTTPASTQALGAQHMDEHGQYYDATAVYPGSTALAQTAGKTADTNAVAVMRGFEQNTIDAFKENGNFANLTANDIHTQGLDQGRKYSVDITYKTYQSAHTLSYVYTIYEDTLGAHPNAYYRTFTFNLQTGNGMTLGDVFAPGTDYATVLSKISRTQLPAVEKKISGTTADTQMLDAGTTPDADNFQNWYLDGTNLVIVFPPYQVAAYALGTILLPIPLSQLTGSLAPGI